MSLVPAEPNNVWLRLEAQMTLRVEVPAVPRKEADAAAETCAPAGSAEAGASVRCGEPRGLRKRAVTGIISQQHNLLGRNLTGRVFKVGRRDLPTL